MQCNLTLYTLFCKFPEPHFNTSMPILLTYDVPVKGGVDSVDDNSVVELEDLYFHVDDCDLLVLPLK